MTHSYCNGLGEQESERDRYASAPMTYMKSLRIAAPAALRCVCMGTDSLHESVETLYLHVHVHVARRRGEGNEEIHIHYKITCIQQRTGS